MTVTTKTLSGEQVTVSDFEYFTMLGNGTVPFPDFVFLFDTTGYSAEPFTKAGYTTLIVDMLNVGPYTKNDRAHTVANWNILAKEAEIVFACKNAKLIVGFPPCDDMASSGAKHFDYKAAVDPQFQQKAIHLFRSVERIGNRAGKAWVAENPRGKVGTLYRPRDYAFSPYEYGGYLPADDEHPDYPKYIAPRDAYPKETFLWCGNGFRMPPKNPVVPEPGYSRQFRLLGGNSAKTKRIRSSSPRGFFRALYFEYCSGWR